MNEDDIARGVARGLREHERRRAEEDARSLLTGLGIMAALFLFFIWLVTYA
ncbi:hypothetical protein [Streptomyces sp. NPDC058548]|uniref:hypothetical protein n=1 Tax=Streptomyces sp. NPDC058548 TaxID=3346545 RepID=UPI00365BE56C